jgi:hypothetical protein
VTEEDSGWAAAIYDVLKVLAMMGAIIFAFWIGTTIAKAEPSTILKQTIDGIVSGVASECAEFKAANEVKSCGEQAMLAFEELLSKSKEAGEIVDYDYSFSYSTINRTITVELMVQETEDAGSSYRGGTMRWWGR